MVWSGVEFETIYLRTQLPILSFSLLLIDWEICRLWLHYILDEKSFIRPIMKFVLNFLFKIADV